MRKLTFWMLALTMVLALASCSEKDVPVDSAADPLPFPMDAYKSGFKDELDGDDQ